jgi:hypothetical protein
LLDLLSIVAPYEGVRMKRLAIAFALATMTSGCIFFTPPSGIRLGNHANEYDQPGQTAGVSAGAASEYRAGDFTLVFPAIWSASNSIDLLSRDASLIKRISIGQASQNGDVEGVQVTTLLQPLDPDPAKNLQALTSLILKSLQAGLKSDAKVLANESKPLDGGVGNRIEIAGTGLDQLDTTTNQVIAGTPQHYMAQCSWHQGHGYIIVLSTTEALWSSRVGLFGAILDGFKFTGVPVGLCTPSARPSGAAQNAAATGAVQNPVASGAAIDSPSTAGSLVVCFGSPTPAGARADGAATGNAALHPASSLPAGVASGGPSPAASPSK